MQRQRGRCKEMAFCMQDKKQRFKFDMEQWAGSKLEREYLKAVYCHSAYLTSMQSSVQSLSHVWLFEILWTTACQASLSITNSQSSLKLMSIESVMPSNHLILCHPLLLLPSNFPSIRVFSNESVLRIRWQKSVLPMKIQDWFPLGWAGWISLQPKGLSRVFSNTTDQKHQFFGTQLSL